MSAPRTIDLKDVKSALRHTVIPIVSGAAVAGLQAVQVGAVNRAQVQTAVVTALIAGVIRLLQRWCANMPAPPT